MTSNRFGYFGSFCVIPNSDNSCGSMIFNRPAGKKIVCAIDHFWLKNKQNATRINSSKFIAFFIRHWWFQCTSFFIEFFNLKYIERPLFGLTLFLLKKNGWTGGQTDRFYFPLWLPIIVIFTHIQNQQHSIGFIILCYNATKKKHDHFATPNAHIILVFVVFFFWN